MMSARPWMTKEEARSLAAEVAAFYADEGDDVTVRRYKLPAPSPGVARPWAYRVVVSNVRWLWAIRYDEAAHFRGRREDVPPQADTEETRGRPWSRTPRR